MSEYTAKTVTLQGGALYGIHDSRVRHLVEQLPRTVCLGRVVTPVEPSVLRFFSYFDASFASNLPVSTNRRSKAAATLARMFLNDRYGCCVISGKLHAIGLWGANDNDSGGEVIATDQEVLDQYNRLKAGPGDSGCVITHVLDYMRAYGLKASGKTFKIDGYVSLDLNKDLIRAALFLFGAGTFGLNLPDAWTKSAVWDVTNTPIVGGHDVSPIDFDESGVYVSSWGRVYLMTWAAVLSARWNAERYAMLAPAWYGNDKLAPCGVNFTSLKDDLTKIGGGVIPVIDPPTPPTPPTPPQPSLPAVLVALDAEGKEIGRYKAA